MSTPVPPPAIDAAPKSGENSAIRRLVASVGISAVGTELQRRHRRLRLPRDRVNRLGRCGNGRTLHSGLVYHLGWQSPGRSLPSPHGRPGIGRLVCRCHGGAYARCRVPRVDLGGHRTCRTEFRGRSHSERISVVGRSRLGHRIEVGEHRCGDPTRHCLSRVASRDLASAHDLRHRGRHRWRRCRPARRVGDR